MSADPVRVGLLFDFPQADGGRSFEQALSIGYGEVASTSRLNRDIEVVKQLARGLPAGTARDVEARFAVLEEAGVLVVVGPSISDNGVFVKDLADSSGLPCVNYTGGEMTRSEMMFHYQVGSVEEEPAVLADHLSALGIREVAVVHDRSPVGRGYAAWFEEVRSPLGIEVLGTAVVDPLSVDMSSAMERLRATAAPAVVYLGLGQVARALSLALASARWDVPVFANSGLMFGYARRDWREAWEGWTYVDTVSDTNSQRCRLRELSRSSAAGPLGVAAYDIGRMVGEGIARSVHLTRDGLREGLERVKRLPAASGLEGTSMGFGRWDRAALKGEYLVLRAWADGRSVEVHPRV